MRVAILAPTYWSYSGPDRVAEQQAKSLCGQNEVTIFTLSSNMAPPPGVQLRVLGMPDNSLLQRIYRLLFPLNILGMMRWVRKLRDYDVMYCHQYPMTWLGYWAKTFYGVEYVYYNHGLAPPKTFPKFTERVYMKAFCRVADWTIRRADRAISVSRFLQRELLETTGIESEVVYNSIDRQRFHRGPDVKKIRERLDIKDAPVVLYVGRISPHKGVHLLLDAFDLVKERVPESKLVLVGKRTFSDYPKKTGLEKDSSVIFAEDVRDDDLPSYYAACDVYATASLWEGFNLPLVEAQACGKPVVAFDIGAHPEVVANHGSGTLVPKEDIVAFADAIVEFLLERQRLATL